MIDEMKRPDWESFEDPLAAFLSACLDEWYRCHPDMTFKATCMSIDNLRDTMVENVLREGRKDLF